MDIYHLIHKFSHLGGSRVKLAAIWAMHVARRRYLGVFIDPILGCNYRCQMCYFSNQQTRQTRHGRMTAEQIDHVAQSIFHRTLKLQIGCGAEPSIDMSGTLRLVEQGKKYGVPYIAMTSNAVLISYEQLIQLVEAGLNELTISLHGIHRDTYQKLMGKTADYDAFLRVLQTIKCVKAIYPEFVVRVNYTMNADNVDELADFDTLFEDIPINVLQLRPIRRIGDSEYQNFDLSHVSECLETVLRPLAERCKQSGIAVLFPEQIHIEHFESPKEVNPRVELISLFTYINITAQSYPRNDIHFETENYEQYSKRVRLGWQIFKGIWVSRKRCAEIGTSLPDSLNYDVR